MNRRTRHLLTFQSDDTDYSYLKARGELGLNILGRLVEKHETTAGPATLITAAAFTNSDDAWTTASSATLARKLLDDHFQPQGDQSRDQDQYERASFIEDDVLTRFLRPLFARSRPATVTAAGRKAEFVEPGRYDNAGADAEAQKPWKYERRYAVTVFEWAVLQSDVGFPFF